MKTNQQRRVEHKLSNGQTLSNVELQRLLNDSKRLSGIDAEHAESIKALDAKIAAVSRTNRSLQETNEAKDHRIASLEDSLRSLRAVFGEIKSMSDNADVCIAGSLSLIGT